MVAGFIQAGHGPFWCIYIQAKIAHPTNCTADDWISEWRFQVLSMLDTAPAIRTINPDVSLSRPRQQIPPLPWCPKSVDRLRFGWLNGFFTCGVRREQRMLKGHLPRVMYHQMYQHTKIEFTQDSAGFIHAGHSAGHRDDQHVGHSKTRLRPSLDAR